MNRFPRVIAPPNTLVAAQFFHAIPDRSRALVRGLRRSGDSQLQYAVKP
jgi:hypothetical protein